MNLTSKQLIRPGKNVKLFHTLPLDGNRYTYHHFICVHILAGNGYQRIFKNRKLPSAKCNSVWLCQ